MALSEIINELENTKDELLDDVISFFDNSEQQITISIIQRKFQLGYNRANRIARQMENELKEKRESIIKHGTNS